MINQKKCCVFFGFILLKAKKEFQKPKIKIKYEKIRFNKKTIYQLRK